MEKGDNITYVPSTNLDGMALLSTLTIETTTTTSYDELNSSITTETFKEIEESQEETTHKMRKVLKHIYKRPIHSENDEKINKQDVLLNYRNSGKDLLTVFEKKLTDVNKSKEILMKDASTTDSGILNKEYHKTTEYIIETDSIFDGSSDNNVFEMEKVDLEKGQHQIGEGMWKVILFVY